jgi:hypothetical protein
MMTIVVSLQVDPRALPEGMSEDDLVALTQGPFQQACTDATRGMKAGAGRRAFLLAALPMLFHEALAHVGVDQGPILSWNAWTSRRSGDDLNMAVTWISCRGGAIPLKVILL